MPAPRWGRLRVSVQRSLRCGFRFSVSAMRRRPQRDSGCSGARARAQQTTAGARRLRIWSCVAPIRGRDDDARAADSRSRAGGRNDCAGAAESIRPSGCRGAVQHIQASVSVAPTSADGIAPTGSRTMKVRAASTTANGALHPTSVRVHCTDRREARALHPSVVYQRMPMLRNSPFRSGRYVSSVS